MRPRLGAVHIGSRVFRFREWRLARARFPGRRRLRAPPARQRPTVSGPAAGRPETVRATVRTRNGRHKE